MPANAPSPRGFARRSRIRRGGPRVLIPRFHHGALAACGSRVGRDVLAGLHSPGGYSMAAGFLTEVVMTAAFFFMGATDERVPKGLAAGRHRPLPHHHPPGLDPGDQHLGESGPQHRAGPHRRRVGAGAALDVLGGAAHRRSARCGGVWRGGHAARHGRACRRQAVGSSRVQPSRLAGTLVSLPNVVAPSVTARRREDTCRTDSSVHW